MWPRVCNRGVWTRQSSVSCTTRCSSTGHSKTSKLLDSMLGRPTWSTKSMLPAKGSDLTDVEPITSAQLDHLLKLSALPKPKDAAARRSMIKDLTEQMHFVKTVQDVDTSKVLPLHNLTAEDDHEELTYESAVADGEAMNANNFKSEADYTKLAQRTRNRYFTVDGGLVADTTEKKD